MIFVPIGMLVISGPVIGGQGNEVAGSRHRVKQETDLEEVHQVGRKMWKL